MIDSVLKGTGNSRFLKSAVPAGTSWADALAMLQAGTFPIDFNGINAEGFQQVGTPLNKANLLKDATAAQIGLPPSTTPDGMFQALGNTGELHVWRKTVTTTQEIPAGYTLGDTITSLKVAKAFTVQRKFTVKVAASISVDDAGTVTLNNPTSNEYGFDVSAPEYLGPQVAGKFVQFSSTEDNVEVAAGTWFFETTASASFSNRTYYVTKAKPVNAYPLTPAGTTTTYPVSTNPNAYQEGDDAKEAGYVVGDAITGKFVTGGSTSAQTVYWNCSSTIEVHNDGNLALISPITYQIHADNKSAVRALLGKFAVVTNGENYISGSPFAQKQIVYIPSDAVVDTSTMSIDRYQPVTGYAAIPAGTTIEYLGKLGNKARVQVLSYVGTGTYGSSNPNSLTFDFPPKFFAIMCDDNHYGRNAFAIRGANYMGYQFDGNSDANIITWEGAKFSWYFQNGANKQYNASGKTYYAIAIG